MKKLSLPVKSLSVCLILVLFTNSIGHAKEPLIPNVQVKCGEWKIESAGPGNDQRIGVKLLEKATGEECSGLFTLSNKTGTILGGGYAMQLKVTTNNAITKFLPQVEPLLLPGFDIKLQTIPINISDRAEINIQGDLTWRAFAWDLGFFLLKASLELAGVPCDIPDEQIFLASLRSVSSLQGAAQAAYNLDFNKSKDELLKALPTFWEQSDEALKDLTVGCSIDLAGFFLNKPVAVAKIILAYLTWVPVVIFNYFKYQGFLTAVSLSYFPPIPPTPTSAPEPVQSFYYDSSLSSVFSPLPLSNSRKYLVTVIGTFSLWESIEWGSVCKGQKAEPAPLFPSPGKNNGKVGADAEFNFARPSSYCQGSDIGRTGFEFSTIIGVFEDGIYLPVSNIEKHEYVYTLMGHGYPLTIRLIDVFYEDNYGQFLITITPQ